MSSIDKGYQSEVVRKLILLMARAPKAAWVLGLSYVKREQNIFCSREKMPMFDPLSEVPRRWRWLIAARPFSCPSLFQSENQIGLCYLYLKLISQKKSLRKASLRSKTAAPGLSSVFPFFGEKCFISYLRQPKRERPKQVWCYAFHFVSCRYYYASVTTPLVSALWFILLPPREPEAKDLFHQRQRFESPRLNSRKKSLYQITMPLKKSEPLKDAYKRLSVKQARPWEAFTSPIYAAFRSSLDLLR